MTSLTELQMKVFDLERRLTNAEMFMAQMWKEWNITKVTKDPPSIQHKKKIPKPGLRSVHSPENREIPLLDEGGNGFLPACSKQSDGYPP